MNKLRLEKLKVKIDCVNTVFDEARTALMQKIKNRPEEYKTVLKNLLIQGFIKLLENEVNVICKKEDFEMVTGVMEEAQKKFLELLNKDSKKFQNFTMNVTVDTKYYLPEFM
jgi:V-type H+-transporting ATPase subunit E